MKFGIFDHVDDSGLPLDEHLEARLKMAETYDALGFYCYHVAEHHGTKLGHAPSPALLFSAISQRTNRIKFGPLVCLLPLYHPMRVIEEVAMLDNLSGGRYQFGFGRGASPIEASFFGVDAQEQTERYLEAFDVVMKGFANDRLDHKGRFFSFDDVPIRQRPLQQPHPPLWYGSNSPESIARAAQEGWNLVTLATGDRLAEMLKLFRAEWAAKGGAPNDLPHHGAGRYVVVADSDGEAKALAAPAYAKWATSFASLWKERGVDHPMIAHLPPDWEALEAAGSAIAGSPATVRNFLGVEAEKCGNNYTLVQLAFGDLSLEAVQHSAELFASEVMPHIG